MNCNILVRSIALIAALAFSGACSTVKPSRGNDLPLPITAEIRRAAGIAPADTAANAQITLTHMGRHASDPMIAILANRDVAGIWQVSYACSASYRCADGANYYAKDYALTEEQSAYVDIAIDRLRRAPPESMPARDGIIAAKSGLSVRLPDLTLDVSNQGPVQNVVDDFRTALTAPLAR